MTEEVPTTTQHSHGQVEQGNWREVFATFLKLGLTSFGGPIAHLGYFHREVVQKRQWIDDTHYAQLVGLCQFLPGPASSQVGFSLGLLRAGWAGAIAAFVAFTLPSALLLVLFAHIMPSLGHPIAQAAIHGLKLLAVAVVAQGVLTMAKRLTPDTLRRVMALAAAGTMIAMNTAATQLALILAGAIAGAVLCRTSGAGEIARLAPRHGTQTGIALFIIFVALLALSFLPFSGVSLSAVGAAFYRAGALVFGGGHVVLPLLQQSVVTPGWDRWRGILGRLRRGASGTWPDVFVRSIRGRSRPRCGWTNGCGRQHPCDISTGPSACVSSATVLAWPIARRDSGRRHRGSECRGRRHLGSRALQPSVDQRCA
jgi:chromate transport protein ChrA